MGTLKPGQDVGQGGSPAGLRVSFLETRSGEWGCWDSRTRAAPARNAPTSFHSDSKTFIMCAKQKQGDQTNIKTERDTKRDGMAEFLKAIVRHVKWVEGSNS